MFKHCFPPHVCKTAPVDPSHLPFRIERQPDQVTCGATCLHAVYRYFGLETDLLHLVRVIPQLKTGGTHGVLLGQHALKHGFHAELITYNLHMFDPTWFHDPRTSLTDKLQRQMQAKTRPGFQRASRHYLDFLKLGGRITHRELNAGLIRGYLKKGLPILTGLNSTYLYQEKRVIAETDTPDEFAGTPEGHFVVICGANPDKKTLRVADPYHPNVLGTHPVYDVPVDRVLNAILLGIVTYDANLLILHPAQTEA